MTVKHPACFLKSPAKNFPQLLCFGLLLVALCISAVPPAHAAEGQYIQQNTPAFVQTAQKVSAESPSKTIEVSIWLQPHNRSQLDLLARNLYDPASPQYRHWLTTSQIAAQFAPSAAEAKTVQDFFTSHNLKVVRTGPNNFYVRARGTVADVENTFHVQLNYYQVGNQTLRANATDPYIEGAAASLVQTVSGLDTAQFEHPLDVRSAGPVPSSPGLPAPGTLTGHSKTTPALLSRAASATDTTFFNTVCFAAPTTETFTTNGSYPIGTYNGNLYYAPNPGCGYSPANVYGAYQLDKLYAEGFNGAGQTIVIVDWCGSPTITQDANMFAAKFGLPPLTSKNFAILNVPGPSACSSVDLEINLDVEWSHAIAPGANIDLVVPPTSSYQDVDEAIFYAINNDLGNVISGSYTTPEFFVADTELSKENLISEIAAVAGIATNFASGDLGNYGAAFLPPTVSVPADLPYATGVGGVSLALNADNSIAFQTGWETHQSILIQGGTIYDPPHNYDFTGFAGGSGGGASAYFTKPSYQKGITGKYRKVPDIAWLADPYTGAVVMITETGQLPDQLWLSVGGTSLSTPMFSALWAIANQEAGVPLGQAAPYLYAMPAGLITDILPGSAAHNVTATVQVSSTVTHRYSSAQTLEVIPGLFGTSYSAMWNVPAEQDTVYDVSFGGDYYLKVKPGWDEVTGLGTPNALAFADWFAPASADQK